MTCLGIKTVQLTSETRRAAAFTFNVNDEIDQISDLGLNTFVGDVHDRTQDERG